MKRAAFYARVSSDLQKKEKTIESQIAELKKQIASDGNVLVKEYVDNGYTGARLDRPAMDELRRDLKTNLFDAVYCLNTDRIAREVTYQTIIIAEILKYKKQIIINGKDYVHNPENKFTVTVLGAVAELERAKIIERTVRARQHRLVEGKLLGCGNNIYGYDYHKRTPTSDPYYTINEEEARVVRYVFETYAKGNIGTNQITRQLEEMGAPTKRRKNIWRTSLIKCMTRNEMYTGTRYFNTMRLIREYANPMHGVSVSSRKIVRRDRSDWIGIKVPAIISKELFDKVQERIEWNRKRYRNPKRTQLLSNLLRCGCGDTLFALSRYYKVKLTDGTEKLYFRTSYRCNWAFRARMHSKKTTLDKPRCKVPEIVGYLLEEKVDLAISETMLNPTKLRACMAILQERKQSAQIQLQRKLNRIDKKVAVLKEKKQRVTELYASREIDKEAYVERCIKYDAEITELNGQRNEITSQIPLIHKAEIIDDSIKSFCNTAQLRLKEATDFDTKRRFFLDYLEKVVYNNEVFSVYGHVPIIKENVEVGKIEFKIPGKILRSERVARFIKHRSGYTQISLPQYNGFAR